SHSHHHALQKKSSSFFRRRKKSVSDVAAPPMPTVVRAPMPAPVPAPHPPTILPPITLSVGNDKLPPKQEPSPVSSLRRVMSPYLKGSPTTPGSPNPLSTYPAGHDTGMGSMEDREDHARDVEEFH